MPTSDLESTEPFPDVAAGWRDGAEAWGRFVRSGADYYRHLVHGPALLEACGGVAGLDALDLGCGEGYFARELARRGARVTGVDFCGPLVAMAREEEAREPLGVAYHELDARRIGERWGAGAFPLVTACMSLQDMEDARAVLAAVHDVLEPGGRFAFSVPHPANDWPTREWERDAAGRKTWLKVDRYFETGPAVMDWSMPRLAYRWKTVYWRRTLEEWWGLVTGAGFQVLGLAEPRPSAADVAKEPRLEDCSRAPYFLVWVVER